jgi:hypothetical protein
MCIVVFSSLVLIFYNKSTQNFTRNLGLVDNIMFMLFANSSFVYSYKSYYILNVLINYEKKSSHLINVKFVLVYIIGVQVACCIIV